MAIEIVDFKKGQTQRMTQAEWDALDKVDWRFHWRDDWREIAPVTILVVVLAAIMILVYGCSPAVPSPCTPDQLAAIETAYVAEAVAACDGQTWESCDALPEVRAKYDRIREEWVTCGN